MGLQRLWSSKETNKTKNKNAMGKKIIRPIKGRIIGDIKNLFQQKEDY